jgi:hypothetical protein
MRIDMHGSNTARTAEACSSPAPWILITGECRSTNGSKAGASCGGHGNAPFASRIVRSPSLERLTVRDPPSRCRAARPRSRRDQSRRAGARANLSGTKRPSVASSSAAVASLNSSALVELIAQEPALGVLVIYDRRMLTEAQALGLVLSPRWPHDDRRTMALSDGATGRAGALADAEGSECP